MKDDVSARLRTKPRNTPKEGEVIDAPLEDRCSRVKAAIDNAAEMPYDLWIKVDGTTGLKRSVRRFWAGEMQRGR